MTIDKQNIPQEAIDALINGSKIEAIKHIRVTQGIGLKEAKDIVEQYIDNNPELKQQMQASNSESAKGAMKWILLVIIIVIAVVYLINN